jgi:hypothetical protein
VTPPHAPLPLPRLARLTVMGRNRKATALGDLFADAGRPVRRAGLPLPAELRFADLTDVVFICLPRAELDAYRAALAGPLRDVVAVVATVPGPATLVKAWPDTRVVGAFQQFTAAHFERARLGLLQSDVPVVGDDREATDLAQAIIDELPGFDAVYTGPLRTAAAMEGFTTVVREVEKTFGRPVGFRLDSRRGIRFTD